MLRLTNYHTHSLFCDGAEAPEAYIKTAIDAGFEAIGFSSHAPLPFENQWSIQPGKLPLYVQEILRLKQLYQTRIAVYLGLEADHIPGLSTTFSHLREDYPLDYLIGAVHLVRSEGTNALWFIDGPSQHYDDGLRDIFHDDIRQGVDCYFHQLWDMLAYTRFDLLAHADKIKMNNRGRYFNVEDSWYKDYILQTVDLIAKNGCVVEVNTRGIYKKRSAEFYPSVFMLEALFKKKVPVTISTDAHLPSEISLQWKEAMECLLAVGYRAIRILTARGWEEKAIG